MKLSVLLGILVATEHLGTMGVRVEPPQSRDGVFRASISRRTGVGKLGINIGPYRRGAATVHMVGRFMGLGSRF